LHSATPNDGQADAMICRNQKHGKLCRRHLGLAGVSVVETGRVLGPHTNPNTNCIAAFCRDCRVSTEYRILTQLNEAA
jgi:hypothetical protein